MLWYAVLRDSDDNDWGYGSYDRDEAIRMAEALNSPDAYIAVIEEGNDPICVEEIHLDLDPYDGIDENSFGSECPKNYEEIADYLNQKVTDGRDYSRDAVDAIWEAYWRGEYADAPVAEI